jgi:hypothetical protein
MKFSRRDMMKMLGALMVAPAFVPLFANQNSGHPNYFPFVQKARTNNWLNLPLNKMMEKIAFELIETPYVGGTLDISETETCSVFLDKLDCVTFFETVLGMARCWRLRKYDFEDLEEQVRMTRYRNGKIENYTSRLHYTADWIYENVKNKVVRDVTRELGGEKIKFNTGFMSENPDKYKALSAHPEYVPIIKNQEDAINSRDYYYIPKEKLSKKIEGIQTCDIVAITTSIKGLDYSHIGFAYRNEDEEIQFLHASSAKKEVVLDTYLSKYLNSKSKDTGITVLRAV